MTQTNSSYTIDFAKVREAVDFKAILKHYGLTGDYAARGDTSLVGRCQLGKKEHGKRDSFNINLDKNTFRCFACKKRGSVIDFVRFMEDIGLVQAAELIMEIKEGGGENENADNASAKEPPKLKETSSNDSSVVDDESDNNADDVQFRSAFLRLDEAIDKVDKGEILPHNLVVIDVTAIQLLRELIYSKQ